MSSSLQGKSSVTHENEQIREINIRQRLTTLPNAYAVHWGTVSWAHWRCSVYHEISWVHQGISWLMWGNVIGKTIEFVWKPQCTHDILHTHHGIPRYNHDITLVYWVLSSVLSDIPQVNWTCPSVLLYKTNYHLHHLAEKCMSHTDRVDNRYINIVLSTLIKGVLDQSSAIGVNHCSTAYQVAR